MWKGKYDLFFKENVFNQHVFWSLLIRVRDIKILQIILTNANKALSALKLYISPPSGLILMVTNNTTIIWRCDMGTLLI